MSLIVGRCIRSVCLLVVGLWAGLGEAAPFYPGGFTGVYNGVSFAVTNIWSDPCPMPDCDFGNPDYIYDRYTGDAGGAQLNLNVNHSLGEIVSWSLGIYHGPDYYSFMGFDAASLSSLMSTGSIFGAFGSGIGGGLDALAQGFMDAFDGLEGALVAGAVVAVAFFAMICGFRYVRRAVSCVVVSDTTHFRNGRVTSWGDEFRLKKRNGSGGGASIGSFHMSYRDGRRRRR